MYAPSAIFHCLENGTKRAAARPILKPALASQQAAFLSSMSDAIAQGIVQELR